MNRRTFLFGASALACVAVSPAAAQTAEEQVIAQLRAQGYSRFRVSRTMLGRVRILASGPAGEREIVLNPGTGTILRDHVERDRSDRGGDDDRDDDDDDDDDRDDDDDDRDDDRDDDDDDDDNDDNSGSGGGDDDDDGDDD